MTRFEEPSFSVPMSPRPQPGGCPKCGGTMKSVPYPPPGLDVKRCQRCEAQVYRKGEKDG